MVAFCQNKESLLTCPPRARGQSRSISSGASNCVKLRVSNGLRSSARKKHVRLESCSRDPIALNLTVCNESVCDSSHEQTLARFVDRNAYRYVINNPNAFQDASGLDRQVMMWLSHMFIVVDTYDPNGNVNGSVALHFSPQGYTIESNELWPTFAVSVDLHSTQDSDEQLVELWQELERLRKEGKLPSWNPGNNCWVPSMQFRDYPRAWIRTPANHMQIFDPVGP